MIDITTTDKISLVNGIKVLVYGAAGVGKTTLASTLPDLLLISAESGELSLRKFSIPMVSIKTLEQFDEVYNWLAQGGDNWAYRNVMLDSCSEIAEVVLNNLKQTNKDGRQAYNKVIEEMEIRLRNYRDLPGRNVIFICRMESVKDEFSGMMQWGPSMPGTKLPQRLPYFFDLILYLGINKDNQGKTFRFLQTQPDVQHHAKDRSGVLDDIEPPNLSHIFNKILTAQ